MDFVILTMHKLAVGATEIIKNSHGVSEAKSDLLAVEEPLEIRLGYGDVKRIEKSIAVTMRTPGNDFELATGFLFTEGIIHSIDDVLSVVHCQNVKEEEQGNVVRVELKPGVEVDLKSLERNFYTNSSCGVCGKASIDSIHQNCPVIISKLKIEETAIHKAPDKLREAQRVFEYTGGLHACGMFDSNGDLVLMREDVGRHNAMDKLIGAGMEQGINFSEHFVLVSGRASFELVQKAVMAGFPLLAAVGAPSSLAVDLARKFNQTLLGFVRNNSFNVYTCVQRVQNS